MVTMESGRSRLEMVQAAARALQAGYGDALASREKRDAWQPSGCSWPGWPAGGLRERLDVVVEAGGVAVVAALGGVLSS
jgi:hypothetical protein